MSISDKDLKLLWGRAAGHCSAPRCPVDLLPLLAKSGDVVLGEMAHIIGRSPDSARADASIGSDDSYDNLILLCPNHHTAIDKAPADYPADTLRKWKHNWEATVARRLLPRFSVHEADALEMRMWTYFNFDLILNLYRSGVQDGQALNPLLGLKLRNIVNGDGFPLNGSQHEYSPRTIFETWPQDTARELQNSYSEMVEELIHANPPLDLNDMWGIRKFRGLLYPTAIAFLNRRFTFKTIRQLGEREIRQMRCKAGGIEVQCQMDTWSVFSNSALTLHFRGASRVAAFLLIRSVEPPGEGSHQTRLVVKATPIALGSGFAPSHDRTPPIASRRFWSEDEGEVGF